MERQSPDHYTRSRHKECSKRGVPNKLSKKFEKPLDKPLDLWYNEYIK